MQNDAPSTRSSRRAIAAVPSAAPDTRHSSTRSSNSRGAARARAARAGSLRLLQALTFRRSSRENDAASSGRHVNFLCLRSCGTVRGSVERTSD